MKYILKDTIKSIRQSLSKFVTLTCIVMLGVSFFVGLMAAPPSMEASIENFDDLNNLHDYQIISTLGFDQADIDGLTNQPYIETVQPYYFVDCYTQIGRNKSVIRLEGSDGNETIDTYEIVEGRDIQTKDEIILLYSEDSNTLGGNYDSPVLSIGDTITVFLDDDDDDIYESIDQTTFTIVGFYRDAKYITKMLDTSTLDNQQLSQVGIIDQSNFVMEAIPSVVISIDGAKGYDSFSDDYHQYMDGVTTTLDPIFEQGAKDRTQTIKDDANQELEDARQELADAQQEYDDGYQEFIDEITDAQNQIDDGQAELNDAYQELIDGQAELDTNKNDVINELHDAEQEINDGKAQLQEGWDQYYAGKEAALAQLEAAKQTVDAASNQIESGKTTLQQSLSIIPGLYDNLIPIMDNYAAVAYGYGQAGNQDVASIISQTSDQYQQIYDLLLTTFQSMIDEDQFIESARPQAEQAAVDDVLANRELMLSIGSIYDSSKPEGAPAWSELDDTAQRAVILEYVQNNTTIQEGITNSLRQEYSAIIEDPEQLMTLIQQYTGQTIDLNALTTQIATLAIGDGLAQYGQDAYQEGYDQAMQQLDHAKWELDRANAQLVEASEEVISGWDEANQEFADAQAKIDDGWVQYNDGVQELEDARQELADGKAEGEAELKDAAQKISNAQVEIDDAQQQIDDIEDCEWIVLDRGSHYSSAMYANTITTMTVIGLLFPIFFILVAMLVCLTTMTRMVDEERTLIGTYRSLGFTKGQSCAKFLIYAAIAAVIGSVIGSILGVLIFPIIIYNAWGMMYYNPEFVLVIPWGWLIGICALFIFLMVLTTYLTCRKNMKEVPAQLMRPAAPKNAHKTLIEHITPLWNALSFTMKVTMRNIFRYKKRFFMTVIGVAGCTSLIVCGLGIKDVVGSIGTVQFGEIYNFDATISYDDFTNEQLQQKVDEYTSQSFVESVDTLYSSNVTVGSSDASNDSTQTSTLYVSSVDAINEVFNLRDKDDQHPLTMDANGIIVSNALARYFDVRVGDSLVLTNLDDQEATFTVIGICEMYVNHHIFMSDQAYQNGFGSTISANTLALSTNDESSLLTMINEDTDLSAYSLNSTVIEFVNQMVGGFNIIVIVCVAAAGALAFVVLGNLTSVNISERTREIATLKVLGFTSKEVHHYVYYENIILTFIGALFGLVFGKSELTLIMSSIKMDNMSFGSNISTPTYIVSFIITIIFAMLVNKVMEKHLDNINMVESLKSVE